VCINICTYNDRVFAVFSFGGRPRELDHSDRRAVEPWPLRPARTVRPAEDRKGEPEERRRAGNDRRPVAGNGFGRSSTRSVRSARRHRRQAANRLRTDIFALGWCISDVIPYYARNHSRR